VIIGTFVSDHLYCELLDRTAGGFHAGDDLFHQFAVGRFGVLVKLLQELGNAPAGQRVHAVSFLITDAIGLD
jgi:hypothetical protein